MLTERSYVSFFVCRCNLVTPPLKLRVAIKVIIPISRRILRLSLLRCMIPPRE
jgi:hypothetical protein